METHLEQHCPNVSEGFGKSSPPAAKARRRRRRQKDTIPAKGAVDNPIKDLGREKRTNEIDSGKKDEPHAQKSLADRSGVHVHSKHQKAGFTPSQLKNLQNRLFGSESQALSSARHRSSGRDLRRKVSLRGLSPNILNASHLLDSLQATIDSWSIEKPDISLNGVVVLDFYPGKFDGIDSDALRPASATLVLEDEVTAKKFCKLFDGKNICAAPVDLEENADDEVEGSDQPPSIIVESYLSILEQQRRLKEASAISQLLCTCDLATNPRVSNLSAFSCGSNSSVSEDCCSEGYSSRLSDDIEFLSFLESLSHGTNDYKMQRDLLNDHQLAYRGDDTCLLELQSFLPSSAVKSNRRKVKPKVKRGVSGTEKQLSKKTAGSKKSSKKKEGKPRLT